MTKICTKCLITKSVDDYYVRDGKPIAACKDCTKKSTKRYKVVTGQIKGNYGKSRFEDLIGKKIGDWEVIGPISKSKSSRVTCKCKCGDVKEVICSRLEKGLTKGCRKCYPVHGSNSHLFKGVGEISSTYLRHISEGARERGLDIDLSAEQLWDLYLRQNKKCALTGLEIGFGKHIQNKHTKLQSQTASLDRISSEKGYTIDNVQWVHKHVNIMKNKYDMKYFIEICKLVTEYDKNKDR